ncbi:DUF4348 domain-containing protein [Xylanibacter caecicola]|uniref:DUF4348 domain-containing protein n=2 Tax=Xylanibacter caecicola TaxID=2736294 RepID=UPI0025859CC2|nr:DUF4348 domain-containing protein [Xylanibacter caecicola]
MRKCFLTAFVVCVCMMFWTTGCTERKPIADSLAVDSVIDTTLNVDTMEQLIEEQPMPVAADELFDDFIFNFAANHKLQIKRIKFPLQVDDCGEKRTIAKSDWKMEHFFMEQGFYTLIFDTERQMNAVKDTTINNVVVEKINLANEKVKDYVFKRINGAWMLVAIRKSELSQHPNSSFLSFYQKFATDASFQERSLNNPVIFTGQDPDDDFSTMTGEIAPETWPAFAPELPSGKIYNIIYGHGKTSGNQKIFLMRGISNGMEMQLTFKCVGGDWKLVKLSE